MEHIDEHTLELYVLGAPEAEPRRREIDAHLPVCQGCRLLVEEMRRFHADLADELEKPEAAASQASALARRHQGMTLFGGEDAPPVRYQPRTPMQKVRYFIVRYPVAAAAAGISIAALLVGLGMLLALPMKNAAARPPAEISDWNPSFYVNNPDAMQLEVYNAEQQLLWSAKLNGKASELRDRTDRGVSTTCIADLNGDGAREVISISPFASDETHDVQHLRVYDGRKKLVKDTSFVEDVPYLDRSYSPYITLSDVRVMDSDEPGVQELIVSGNSLARSPRLILRIGKHFQVMGRYWHFGDLGPLRLRDLDGDGKPELIALGQNDIDDAGTLGQFGALVVLDPRRIVGTTRSTTAPGFRFAPSDAERFYVRFPATELDSVRGHNARAYAIEMVDARRFSVTVGVPEVYFHYFFTFDMNVTEVKSNDIINRTYAEMARQGKLRSPITPGLLQALKGGVRYWDGTSWRREVTSVRHAGSPP